MPKRSIYTPKGRALLRGPRRIKQITPKGFPKPKPPITGPIYVRGKKLNAAEAQVWFKLRARRGEDWEPQVRIGLNSGLGSGQTDFLSNQRRQVIEVDGPFHKGIVGEARDFMRNLVRQQAGFQVVRVPWPLPHNLDRYLNTHLGRRR